MKINEKVAPATILIFVLVGMLCLSFNVQKVEAGSTIYIKADGSIEPSEANITTTDNVTYTFTGNNYDSLVIERDNIIVNGAGYTIQAKSGNGIDLSSRSNVTIKNVTVDASYCGVKLYYSSNNTISSCNVKNAQNGISLGDSSDNSIYGNYITKTDYEAIRLYGGSSNNWIYGNTLVANIDDGIDLSGWGYHNRVYHNNITENQNGIMVSGDSNSVYENNVTRNDGMGVHITSELNNVSGNYVAENKYGVFVMLKANTLRNNIMVNNTLNFGLTAQDIPYVDLEDFYNDVDVSNTVNGKPVYYWVDRQNADIPLDAGAVVLVNCKNITVQNLTLESNLEGVLLAYSNNCIVSGNNVTDNGDSIYYRGGIALYHSSNNHIYMNNITANHNAGVELQYSLYNTVSQNNITKNGVGVHSYRDSHYNNFSGNRLRNNLRGIRLLSSTNNTVYDNDIIGPGYYGISIETGSNNILRNNLVYNKHGIDVKSSYNNITGNTIMENWESGVFLQTGVKNNLFFHNNFVDNAEHVSLSYYSSRIINSWNNSYPSGGNYWTDYEDKYPNATELDNSGIWNTSYVINENNIDNYPLIAPTEPITRKFTAYNSLEVEIYSNSSISEFQFNTTSIKLSFNVTGPAGTSGFCNVVVPENLLWGNFSLFINGVPLVEGVNYTKAYNGTHYTFAITYTHSEHIIEIEGTEVIPEFSPALILPLFIVLTMLAVVFAIIKKSKKTQKLLSPKPPFF